MNDEQENNGTTTATPDKPKRTRKMRDRQYIVEKLDDIVGDIWVRAADEECGGIVSYSTADEWLSNHAKDGVSYRISIVTKPIRLKVVTTETRTLITE